MSGAGTGATGGGEGLVGEGAGAAGAAGVGTTFSTGGFVARSSIGIGSTGSS